MKTGSETSWFLKVVSVIPNVLSLLAVILNSPGKVTPFGAKNITNCKKKKIRPDHFYEVFRTY